MEEILEQTWFGNTPREWLTAGIVAAVVFLVLWGLEWLGTRRFARFAERSRFTFDDVIVATLRATRFWFTLAVALWAGSLALALDASVRGHVGTALKLLVVLQAGLWAFAAIGAWVRSYAARRMQTDPSAVTTMSAVGLIARIVVAAFLLLAALQALGFDVTALVAGLGIGGIAVAFALQGVLADLFASLSIVLDKPFVIGDFIAVGTEVGTVEHIGLKTTRVRALSGEQLVFGNADLLASRVRNMKRMSERRVVFGLGVTYQTPRARLEEIPTRVRAMIEARADMRFDRGHLIGFGASSIDFEFVYFVKSPEYNLFRDLHQALMLEIHGWFEGAGIEFAYPTQVVLLAGATAPPNPPS
ncbi:MAG TPA: mechanosensitive ion channel family protein [Longimicrobiales bacterium]